MSQQHVSRRSFTKAIYLAIALTSYSTSFVHHSAMMSTTRAWGAIANAKQRTPRSSGDTSTVMRATRAEAIQRVGCSSALAVGVLLAPRRTVAEEAKDEVQQFSEMKGEIERKGKEETLKENMILLTEATVGLKALDFYIGEKDYQSLRLAMRKPPVMYLRSSARKVITNLDDEAVAKQSQEAYLALMSSVDKLDYIANTGMKEKGGLKDDKEILKEYGNCVERGSALLKLLPASS